MKAAFFNQTDAVGNSDNIERIFGDRRNLISELTDLYPKIITPENFDQEVENLVDIEVVFGTWAMPALSEEQIDRLVSLKYIFYAAGSVRSFAQPYLERGISVCSAIAANGIPVAEFALAQVLLAGAGYFRNIRECVDETSTNSANNYRGHGNYDKRVAILGNGTISTKLQELLTHHHLEVIVVPSRLERRTITLEEAFATSFAVVNLFPNLDTNQGVFGFEHFSSMIDSAVFINVGRGQQVVESELIEVMKRRPDLTALLDVQHPEPPLNGSEFYSLPNILLTGHIAGSKGSEFTRMVDYMIDDFKRLLNGEPFQHAVDPETQLV